jgi:hypothetical protein
MKRPDTHYKASPLLRGYFITSLDPQDGMIRQKNIQLVGVFQ